MLRILSSHKITKKCEHNHYDIDEDIGGDSDDKQTEPPAGVSPFIENYSAGVEYPPRSKLYNGQKDKCLHFEQQQCQHESLLHHDAQFVFQSSLMYATNEGRQRHYS